MIILHTVFVLTGFETQSPGKSDYRPFKVMLRFSGNRISPLQ